MDDRPITNITAANGATAMVEFNTNDGVPKLYCQLCNKGLISLAGYAKHVRKHEPPGGFLCRFCEARFCSDEELKHHHNDLHVTISCRMCKVEPNTFSNESEYREHIRIVHGGQDRELYKCEICGSIYKTRGPYQRHMDSQCGNNKQHKCEQCGMTFMTKGNLKSHIETHSDIRRFCCSYCGKSFAQKGRLVQHERSHTGEKPYKCDVCGKCFAHRESIVTHSSIHTGIRLVECRGCHARFSCHSNLIKHRRARPETCGLRVYDSPKQRLRTHVSRIPAALNPTTEIKVCQLNKTIKQDALEQMQKVEASRKEQQTKPVKEKIRRTRGPGRKPRGSLRKKRQRKSKRKIDDEEEKPSRNTNCNSDDDNPPKVYRTRSSHATKKIKTKAKNAWDGNEAAWDDNECNSPAHDPIESGDSDLELNKLKKKLSIKEEPSVAELINTISEEIDFINTEYKAATANPMQAHVKSEDEDIFKEKDKLIEHLLNESDSGCGEGTQHSEKLQATEIILIKDEQMDLLPELTAVDALDVSPVPLKAETSPNQCAIMLEDVTRRFPKLKKEKTVRIRRHTRKRQAAVKRRTERPASTMRVAKLSLKELKTRMKNEETSWECPHCIKIYYMRKPYEKHLREFHALSEEDIGTIFKDKDKPKLQSDEVFKCHICDKIYLLEKRLLSHIKLHGPDGSHIYKCPCYCFLYFASREDAMKHAHTAHRKMLWCDICEKFLTCHDSYKMHMKSIHEKPMQGPKQRNLVCDKCGRKFSTRTSLNDHVRSDCGRQPIYACHICGKHLTTAGILKTHMLLHKDETPFQCEKCGKTFKVKAQYKTHLKVRHTDDKPFKCHLCPKAYPYRESLLTHMTVHTGIKRFLCNGCGKRFTCISNLQAHRKVHADTCGQLPLNAKATQYMGVQKGNLLLGAKPEAGLDYIETNTLVARDVFDRDSPMAQDINYPTEPLATVPLNYVQHETGTVLPAAMQQPQQYMPDLGGEAATQASPYN